MFVRSNQSIVKRNLITSAAFKAYRHSWWTN